MLRNLRGTKTSSLANPATNRPNRPADYPLGSVQSRAAARAMLEARPQVTLKVRAVATGEIVEVLKIDLHPAALAGLTAG